MRPSITRRDDPGLLEHLQVTRDGGLRDPEVLGSLANSRGAAAESLDDVAADRMSEGLEHIVSHFANYIVCEDVDSNRRKRCRITQLGPRRNGRPSATSCSPRRRSSPAAATSSRRSGRSSPGSRSRRTTASRPIDGTKSLADLFDGRSQLLIYHFMFGPEYDAGCPVCSSIADNITPQVPHLNARDTTADVLVPGAAREAPGLQGADGLGNPLGLVRRDRLPPRPRLLLTPRRSSSRSWRAARSPRPSTRNAEMCGTDAAGYVAEGPG